MVINNSTTTKEPVNQTTIALKIQNDDDESWDNFVNSGPVKTQVPCKLNPISKKVQNNDSDECWDDLVESSVPTSIAASTKDRQLEPVKPLDGEENWDELVQSQAPISEATFPEVKNTKKIIERYDPMEGPSKPKFSTYSKYQKQPEYQQNDDENWDDLVGKQCNSNSPKGHQVETKPTLAQNEKLWDDLVENNYKPKELKVQDDLKLSTKNLVTPDRIRGRYEVATAFGKSSRYTKPYRQPNPQFEDAEEENWDDLIPASDQPLSTDSGLDLESHDSTHEDISKVEELEMSSNEFQKQSICFDESHNDLEKQFIDMEKSLHDASLDFDQESMKETIKHQILLPPGTEETDDDVCMQHLREKPLKRLSETEDDLNRDFKKLKKNQEPFGEANDECSDDSNKSSPTNLKSHLGEMYAPDLKYKKSKLNYIDKYPIASMLERKVEPYDEELWDKLTT